MNFRFVLALLVCLWGGFSCLFAWDWPFDVSEGSEVNAFASLDDGGLVPGIGFALGEKVIHPVEAGEVFFVSQASTGKRFGVFQAASGMVALEHSNHMRSIYAGLANTGMLKNDPALAPDRLDFYSTLGEPDRKNLLEKWAVKRGADLGVSGAEFFLGINDPLEGTSINPWSILPADSLSGGLDMISFRVAPVDSSEPVQGFSWMELPWKEVELYVSCRDPGTDRPPGKGEKGKPYRMPRGTSLVKAEVKMSGNLLAAMDFRVMQSSGEQGRRMMADEQHRRLDLKRIGQSTFSVGKIRLEDGNNPLDIVLENAAGTRTVWRVWLRVKVPAAPVLAP